MNKKIFNPDWIVKPIPKKVMNRTQENFEKFGMSLGDSLKEAARTYSGKTTELYRAFYADDFRAFIPSEYLEKYLDFSLYPLKY